MTHEGRMARGKLKISKGLKDSETEYFLKNNVEEKPKVEQKPKEAKNAKPRQ